MDIALCQNENCEKKLTCYRYMSIPGEQHHIDFKNLCNTKNNYEWFEKIREKDNIKDTKENLIKESEVDNGEKEEGEAKEV